MLFLTVQHHYDVLVGCCVVADGAVEAGVGADGVIDLSIYYGIRESEEEFFQ